MQDILVCIILVDSYIAKSREKQTQLFDEKDLYWSTGIHAWYTVDTICPKKNYNRTFRMGNFQSSE